MSDDASTIAVTLAEHGVLPAGHGQIYRANGLLGKRLAGSRGIDPARALGPTAVVLQSRRRVKAVRESVYESTDNAVHAVNEAVGLTLTTDDGTLRFVLTNCASGLCVERLWHHPADTQLHQYMVFFDSVSFTAWCECEPVRFTHPLLYVQLRRRGHEQLDTA